MFVASFLGNPPINFMDGRLEASAGRRVLPRGDLRLALPRSLAAGVARSAARGGAGHPRRGRLTRQLGSADQCCSGRISRCCRSAPTSSWRWKRQAGRLFFRLGKEVQHQEGDNTELAVNLNRLHLFDKQASQSLVVAPGAAMKPAAFRYHRPASLDEALDLLAELGDVAKLIAGGQSLVPMMNMRLAQPAQLIDLNDLTELAVIRASRRRDRDRRTDPPLRRSPNLRTLQRHCPLLARRPPASATMRSASAARWAAAWPMRTRPHSCRWWR